MLEKEEFPLHPLVLHLPCSLVRDRPRADLAVKASELRVWFKRGLRIRLGLFSHDDVPLSVARPFWFSPRYRAAVEIREDA